MGVSSRTEVKVAGEGGTDREHRDRVVVRRQGEDNTDSGPSASSSKKRKGGGGGTETRQERREHTDIRHDAHFD